MGVDYFTMNKTEHPRNLEYLVIICHTFIFWVINISFYNHLTVCSRTIITESAH